MQKSNKKRKRNLGQIVLLPHQQGSLKPNRQWKGDIMFGAGLCGFGYLIGQGVPHTGHWLLAIAVLLAALTLVTFGSIHVGAGVKRWLLSILGH